MLPAESSVTPGISLLPRTRGPIPERNNRFPMRFACGNAPTGSGARELLIASLILFSMRDCLFRVEFLRAPRHYFRCKDRVVLIDCERMRIEMPSLVRRWPVKYADGFAVSIDFQNPASHRVRHVDKMIRRDKEAKWVTKFPLAKVATVQIENLDTRIFAVADVNQIAVDRNRVRKVELAGTAAFHSPAEEHVAVFIKLQHPRIAFAIGDENISFAIKRHVGRLIKMENIVARHSHSA